MILKLLKKFGSVTVFLFHCMNGGEFKEKKHLPFGRDVHTA